MNFGEVAAGQRSVNVVGKPLDVNKNPLPGRSITPAFGIELDAKIKLLDLSDGDLGSLKQLAAEKGIVVARNQTMTMQQQADFAGRLGPLFHSPMDKIGIPKELLVIRANENSKRVAGTTWHTDVSSETITPGLSMLRMEIAPQSGGDTLFADMYQVYESLSEAMQKFLLTLTARHDPKGHYLYLSGAKKLHELPSVVHPVIRTHPLTGRKALYVNSGFVGRLVELSKNESDSLLTMLFDRIAYSVNAQCRVQWQPDTVVFWDNRIVQHHATFDYFPAVRLGYRATVKGEAPYLDPD
jgi:taurine dioxygenase